MCRHSKRCSATNIFTWNVQTVQEVFCWSRNPMEVRRLTARKEEIYRQLLGDRTPLVPSGVRHLIDVLGKHQARISHDR